MKPFVIHASPALDYSYNENNIRNGGRWIWRTSQGTYIRAKHGQIGVELDRLNQQNEQ